MADTANPYHAALDKLAKLDAEAYEIKRWINRGCEFEGKPAMFPDLQEPGDAPSSRQLSISAGQFFNKPFATAVREILAMRERAAGKHDPASIDEIHAALREGDFNFAAADTEKQKQGLAVSLGKNTVTFRKLPSGLFGLAEWYGPAPKGQRRKVILRGELGDAEAVADEDNAQATDLNEDEAAESPDSDNSAASGPTPNSADEDGREVVHDNTLA